MNSMYFSTHAAKEYFKTHGQFSLTEEELIKVVEIVYVFFTITTNRNAIFVSTDEAQETRKNICLKCPEYNSEHQTCNLCGCFIPNKIKAPEEQCPIDKWLMDTVTLKFIINETIRYINDQMTNDPNAITLEEHHKRGETNE